MSYDTDRNRTAYEVRVTPFKCELHNSRGMSFAVTVNGDEIIRTPARRIAERQVIAVLTHYGVPGVDADRSVIRELLIDGERDGFASRTFYGEGT